MSQPTDQPPFPIPVPYWRWKFLRAEEHLNVLGMDIQWFKESGPYELAVDQKPGLDRARIVVSSVAPLPPKLSTVLGDCLQNLRSSLDHAFEYAMRSSGGTPSDRTEFPVFNREPQNHAERSAWANKIGGVRKDLETVLQGLQPYTRGDKFAGHPLYLLNELARRDKHRRLNLMVLHVSQPFMRIGKRKIPLPPAGPLKQGTVLADLSPEELKLLVEGAKDDVMNVGLHFAADVAFDEEPLRQWPVMRAMTEIRDQVNEALRKLSPFMPGTLPI
jgi:hypothetical protein